MNFGCRLAVDASVSEGQYNNTPSTLLLADYGKGSSEGKLYFTTWAAIANFSGI